MSSSKKRKLEAAGCKITRNDTSTVFLSLICSFSYGLYGSSYSALASSIPQLAPQLHVQTSDFGLAYICRGVGYFLGTILSSYILKLSNLSLTKPFMSCSALVFIAITMFAIAFSKSYGLILFLFLIQGLGFGGVDMMSNCAVPELWGLRAQPWMQLMHTMFGVGSIIGPIIVGGVGFKLAFVIIGFCGLTPIGLLFLVTVLGTGKRKVNDHKVLPGDEENGGSIETTTGNNTTVVPLYETQEFHGVTDEEGEENELKTKQTSAHNQHNPLEDEFVAKSELDLKPHSSAPTEEECSNTPSMPLTFAVKYLTCAFYFLYMGYSTGYGAWVTVYALDVHVTNSDSDAAYLTSAYWLAMTIGRLIAIFVAIHLSATTMMRMKLFECLIAGILLVIISDRSYACLIAATLVFGYADSSIFPLGMTILTDYGFKMDASATTLFMIGTTMGEAAMPAVFGYCMKYLGAVSLPWMVTACCLLLIAVYIVVDFLGRRASNEDGITENIVKETKSNENEVKPFEASDEDI